MAIKKLKKAKPAANTPADNGVKTGPTGETGQYNGYCVKCKEKRDFQGEVNIAANGRKMAKGKCDVCGTGVNRILGKND